MVICIITVIIVKGMTCEDREEYKNEDDTGDDKKDNERGRRTRGGRKGG